MNIAVCDDNVYMTTKLEEIVAACFEQDGDRYQCDVFLAGEELLEACEREPCKYQIYLLDIEMAEKDGLETAAVIRSGDPDAIIIFVTSHEELMPEAFEVMAFHYLVKPVDEEKAKSVILRAIAVMEQKQKLFQFVVRKKIHTLYLGQIIYFESYGRKMLIHTVTGTEYEYYGTLREVRDQVPDRLFVQIHNSYVVNMEHIRMAEAEQIVLADGMTLGITKKFHSAFHKAYRNFVLLHG